MKVKHVNDGGVSGYIETLDHPHLITPHEHVSTHPNSQMVLFFWATLSTKLQAGDRKEKTDPDNAS
jgi:hypothetical protein